MKTKLLLAIVFALPYVSLGAGDAAIDRATLRGLKSVNIVIDRLDPDMVKEGITAESLQSRLMNKLQDANIPYDQASSEFVGLRLVPVRGGRGPYAVSMTIGLYQPVILVRDRNLRTATQTWEVETILMADSKQLFRAAMDSVDELAGRLVTAYRSANPK